MGILQTLSNRFLLRNPKDESVVMVPHGIRPQQGEYSPHYREHMENLRLPNPMGRTRFPIFAYLFNLGNVGNINTFDLVNFDDVISRMNNYTRTLWGDFYEETEFEPWQEIEPHFFKYAFYHDYIYVEWVAEEEKYNLYYKSAAPKLENKEDLSGVNNENWWLNILTNESVYFENPEESLVRYSWDGLEEDRFTPWFKVSYNIEVMLKLFFTQSFVNNKKFIINGSSARNATQEDIDAVIRDIFNTSPCLNKTDGPEDLVKKWEHVTANSEEAGKLLANIYTYMDRETGEMGKVANFNPKQERLIVGEAHMAMDNKIDSLRRLFTQLKLMSSKMVKLGWPPIKFAVNTPENMGMVHMTTQPTEQSGQGEKEDKGENV